MYYCVITTVKMSLSEKSKVYSGKYEVKSTLTLTHYYTIKGKCDVIYLINTKLIIV